MELLICIVLPCVCAFAFYNLGKHHERQAWNNLIEEGKIPRPRTRGGVLEQV